MKLCTIRLVPSPLPIIIERSKNRTSRATLREDKIIIRLARGLSSAEELRHIENLQKRMIRIASKTRKRTNIDPFKDILLDLPESTIQTVTGSYVHFRVRRSTKKRSTAEKVAGGWDVLRGVNDSKNIFHRFLWKLFSESVHSEIETLVMLINEETFKERIDRVHIKYLRSRWGSCSLGKKITLSAPLLFTTPEILRYVIIHELAHIPHPNHSQAFWNAVEKHDPRYRESRIALRKMSL